MNQPMSFEVWMRMVDQKIADLCEGLESDDLEDQTYRDWYDDGVYYIDAALWALENSGFEVE
jgi:hypothetical protein